MIRKCNNLHIRQLHKRTGSEGMFGTTVGTLEKQAAEKSIILLVYNLNYSAVFI